MVLLAIPCAAVLLFELPESKPENLSRQAAPDAFKGLKVGAKRFDSSLMISPDPRNGVALASALEPGTVRTSVTFRIHIGYAGRVYLARRQGERVYLQFSSAGPSENGVFLERARDATLLQDADAMMKAAADAPVLRLVATLHPGGGTLEYQLNGRKARAPLSGKGWLPDLEIRALKDRSLLLVDDLDISRVKADGSSDSVLRHSFGSPAVVMELGAQLKERLEAPRARVAALGLLLLVALLLDLLLLGIHRLARLELRTSLNAAGFLTLAWPTEVMLVMAVRGTLRLSYAAALACLLITLLVRYLTLIGAGLCDAQRKPASWKKALLLMVIGLTLYAGAVMLLARDSLELAGLPLAAIIVAALLGRALPAGALLLFMAQAAAGLLVIAALGNMPVVVWLGFSGIALLVGATVHTLRGKVRGGIVVRILAVLGITVALFFCFELGLRGVPGFVRQITAEERGHLFNLVNSAHGDPLGLLKGKTRISIENEYFKIPPAAGTFRIICLGSSSTAGVGTGDPSTMSYPDKLQELLRARGLDKAQVINAGLAGSSLTQLKVYLEEVLLHLKPDLFILYFGANLDSHNARRYFRDLRKLVASAPYIKTPDELWAATMLPYPSPRSIEIFLALTEWKLFVVSRSLITVAMEQTGLKTVKEAEVPQDLIPETARELVQATARRRIPLVLIPEVLRQAIMTPENLNAGGVPGRTYHYTDIFKKLAAEHHEAGVRFFSVSETYDKAFARRVFPDDMHQTEVGYLHLAKVIADGLEEMGLLPAPPADAP